MEIWRKVMFILLVIFFIVRIIYRVPYIALARTLQEIEAVSARLKMIDILSNYFRSVIVLTPQDLLPSVYLCLNKLAPAYEGKLVRFLVASFLNNLSQVWNWA